MSEENRVTVNILDKEYQVACKPEERHALMRAAQDLDSRMRAVRKNGTIIGVERIAIMVALNLCHEIGQDNSKDGIASADISRLNDKIAAALAHD